MSGKSGKPQVSTHARQPVHRGYAPTVAPRPGFAQDGYQPTTGQGPSTAPSSVPNQPSSVQPPKK